MISTAVERVATLYGTIVRKEEFLLRAESCTYSGIFVLHIHVYWSFKYTPLHSLRPLNIQFLLFLNLLSKWAGSCPFYALPIELRVSFLKNVCCYPLVLHGLRQHITIYFLFWIVSTWRQLCMRFSYYVFIEVLYQDNIFSRAFFKGPDSFQNFQFYLSKLYSNQRFQWKQQVININTYYS